MGIAGGADKCKYLKEIGFDGVIDYKAENVLAALRQHCPKGIDVFFDNVGGDILDAALANLSAPCHGRDLWCDFAIQQYDSGQRSVELSFPVSESSEHDRYGGGGLPSARE